MSRGRHRIPRSPSTLVTAAAEQGLARARRDLQSEETVEAMVERVQLESAQRRRPATVGSPLMGRPFLYLSPHQDDETLWAGRIIAHHVLAGRDVHVVCLTTGESSAARGLLNGSGTSPWWGVPHVPAAEGYAPLDRPTFAAGRDLEQRNAVRCLGVTTPIIAPADRPVDGTLTVAYVRQLASDLMDAYPDAGFWTTRPDDVHPDHAAAGQALADLRRTDPRFTDVRHTARPSQAGLAGVSKYAVPSSYVAEVGHRAANAVNAYRSWSPPEGLFAAGYHSVAPDLEAAVASTAANYWSLA